MSLLARMSESVSAQSAAQDDFTDINNGTNPTLLTTQFGIQYQFNQINSDLNTGVFEAFYTQPFGEGGKRAFRITVPGSDSPFNADPFFGSLQITFGMLTGRAFGGDSQIFVKPGVMLGGDRPADWSLQVGYKVLNF